MLQGSVRTVKSGQRKRKYKSKKIELVYCPKIGLFGRKGSKDRNERKSRCLETEAGKQDGD